MGFGAAQGSGSGGGAIEGTADQWEVEADGDLRTVAGTGLIEVVAVRSDAEGLTIGATGANSLTTFDRGASDTFGDVRLRAPMILGQWGYLCPTASTTLSGSGLLGTITRTGAGTNSFTGSATGVYQTNATTTASGTVAGWSTSQALWSVNTLPVFAIRFRLEDVADVRVFVGLASSQTLANMLDATNPTTQRYVGIQFDTSVPDTNWMFVEDDNTTQTRTSTGVAPEVGTEYWLTVEVNATNSIVLTMRNTSWATLATRTVTSSPLGTGSAFVPVCGLANLGAVDEKGFSTFSASVVLRVGTP
jgi:hypothetical protein